MSDEPVSCDQCEAHRDAFRREIESMVSESRASTLYKFSEMLESRITKLEKKLTDAIAANNNAQNLLLHDIKKTTDETSSRVAKERDRNYLILVTVILILLGVIIGRGWDFLIGGFFG